MMREWVMLSKIVLKSIAPMLDTSDVKPFGIRLEADLTTICYWDLAQVSFVAEVLMHQLHPHEGIFFFPCYFDQKYFQVFSSDCFLSLAIKNKPLWPSSLTVKYNNFQSVGSEMTVRSKASMAHSALSSCLELIAFLGCLCTLGCITSTVPVSISNLGQKSLKMPRRTKIVILMMMGVCRH